MRPRCLPPDATANTWKHVTSHRVDDVQGLIAKRLTEEHQSNRAKPINDFANPKLRPKLAPGGSFGNRFVQRARHAIPELLRGAGGSHHQVDGFCIEQAAKQPRLVDTFEDVAERVGKAIRERTRRLVERGGFGDQIIGFPHEDRSDYRLPVWEVFVDRCPMDGRHPGDIVDGCPDRALGVKAGCRGLKEEPPALIFRGG